MEIQMIMMGEVVPEKLKQAGNDLEELLTQAVIETKSEEMEEKLELRDVMMGIKSMMMDEVVLVKQKMVGNAHLGVLLQLVIEMKNEEMERRQEMRNVMMEI